MSKRWEKFVVDRVVPVLLIVLIPLGATIYLLDRERSASCRATITALDGVRETSLAGVREPVPAEVIAMLPVAQQKFAEQQRDQTLAENQRRAVVADRMTRAIDDLRRSSYCQ